LAQINLRPFQKLSRTSSLTSSTNIDIVMTVAGEFAGGT